MSPFFASTPTSTASEQSQNIRPVTEVYNAEGISLEDKDDDRSLTTRRHTLGMN